MTKHRVIALLLLVCLGLIATPALSGERIYFFHNDHLGTPQALTDAAGRIVWTAEYDPFGKATVSEDPDGDGQKVVNNLRFPGQYYDAETGLHYNWHRYYDPSTGRYLQPDPIGLDGGLNLYGYVEGNPVSNIDPEGLFLVGALPWAGPAIGAACKAIVTVAGVIMTCAAGEKIAEAIRECRDDDKCEPAKADARRIYSELVTKRIPQYMSGGRRGPDQGHHQAILWKQIALRRAINGVRAYCKVMPPELPEWERVANMEIPVLY